MRIDAKNGRFYEIKEGIFYKSYTTVLSMMPTSPFFVKWLKTHTEEEVAQIFNDRGKTGSKIHHTIDLVLKKQEILPSGFTDDQIDIAVLSEPDLVNYLKKSFTETEDFMMKGFFNFLHDYQITTLQTEFTVWDDNIRCAGTVDFYGKINLPVDGKKVRRLTAKQIAKGKIQEEQPRKDYFAIIDWKTGSGIYESHYRQVAGYFKALCSMIKSKVVKYKKPQKAFLLHLGVNKSGYKLVEVEDINTQYKRFRRVNDEWEDANPDAKPSPSYEFMTSYKI